jgi:ribosome-binding protein aMBF1 (putative translation factor)
MTVCPRCRRSLLQAAHLEHAVHVGGRAFMARLPGSRCPRCGMGRLATAPLRRFHLAVAGQLLDAGERSGAVLRCARRALGLSREALAERLGIAPSEMRAWESRDFVYRTALETAGALVRRQLEGTTEETPFVLRGPRPLARAVHVDWLGSHAVRSESA